jgi:DNA-binding response OmpR family regulator
MIATTGRVAIIDDDESVCRGLKRLLQAHHWRVETYESAEEFLERTSSLEVDIALVDIHLPGISGVELLSRLKSEGRGPLIILMTAQGENETTEALLSVGRTFCLRKPFTLAMLNT